MRGSTIAGVVVLGALSGCHCNPPPVVTPSTPGVLSVANNGLTADEAHTFYTTPEGSELFPLRWFLNMDAVVDGKDIGRFADHLDRFGLIFETAPKDRWNLPIGLTVSKPDDLDNLVNMVGVNCAACHVGELWSGDAQHLQRLRIDGAPNLFDIDLFYNQMIGSATDALSHPSRLITMLFGRVDGSLDANGLTGLAAIDPTVLDTLTKNLSGSAGIDALKTSGNDADTKLFEDLQAVIDTDTKAFNAQYNDKVKYGDKLVTALLLGKPDPAGPLVQITTLGNGRVADIARVTALYDFRSRLRLLLARIQFLKNIRARGETHPDDTRSLYGRVDAFGFARNFLFGGTYGYPPNKAPISYPYLWGFEHTKWLHWDGNTTSVLSRNIGQALGVGAIVTSDRPYVTTVIIPNLYTLEQLAYKLKPPQWKEIFPTGAAAIDETKRAAGEQIFKDPGRCIGCHHDNAPDANGLVDYDQEPLAQIGTDPNQANLFAVPLDGPSGTHPFYAALQQTLGDIWDDYVNQYHPSGDDQRKFQGGRPNDWRAELSIPERPLHGVWAIAPYLHNNSVPTLYQLLLPAAQRPTKFKVGDRNYDLKEVGYVWQLDATTTDLEAIFDVTQPGNSNAGHEGHAYGTDLSDDQRWQLIEYLKTL